MHRSDLEADAEFQAAIPAGFFKELCEYIDQVKDKPLDPGIPAISDDNRDVILMCFISLLFCFFCFLFYFDLSAIISASYLSKQISCRIFDSILVCSSVGLEQVHLKKYI